MGTSVDKIYALRHSIGLFNSASKASKSFSLVRDSHSGVHGQELFFTISSHGSTPLFKNCFMGEGSLETGPIPPIAAEMIRSGEYASISRAARPPREYPRICVRSMPSSLSTDTISETLCLDV